MLFPSVQMFRFHPIIVRKTSAHSLSLPKIKKAESNFSLKQIICKQNSEGSNPSTVIKTKMMLQSQEGEPLMTTRRHTTRKCKFNWSQFFIGIFITLLTVCIGYGVIHYMPSSPTPTPKRLSKKSGKGTKKVTDISIKMLSTHNLHFIHSHSLHFARAQTVQ